jgi:hypothetical protein
VRSQKPRFGGARGIWLVVRTLGSSSVDVSSCNQCALLLGDRLSFTGTLRVIPESAIPRVSTHQLPRASPFFTWLTVEILDTLLPERVHRNNQASCEKTCIKVSF